MKITFMVMDYGDAVHIEGASGVYRAVEIELTKEQEQKMKLGQHERYTSIVAIAPSEKG